MAHWVLILFMTAYGGSFVKIEGFSSKENCLIAAAEIDAFYVRKTCMEVK